MSTLYLNLKSIYFNQIKKKEKIYEYRIYDKWKHRLFNKKFDRIVLKNGYPKNSETEKILVRPWLGFEIIEKQLDFFGPKPVKLFAIRVN